MKTVSVLLTCFLLLICLSSCQGEDPVSYSAHPVFFELTSPVQDELLASAIALLTTPNDPYVARLAVGGVLLRRLSSPAWGDSLYEIITPFLTAAPSSLPATEDQGALQAATDALDGFSPFPNATEFGRGTPPEGVKNVAVVGEFWFGE